MYKEKIEQYFETHTQEMLDHIMELMRIPSVGDTPAPNAPYGVENVKALQAAAAMAESFGFSVTNYDNYVIAIDFDPAKEKALDILAHLDVVPAPPEDWTVTQPFVPVIQDGKLYGRGSADDKGPAVAALYALRAIKDMDLPLDKNVRLILGSDEERGSSDLDHYFSKEKEAPLSFTPDADFPVINVEKGRLATTIRGEFSKENQTPCILSFTSGHTVNVIPDEATAVLKGIDEKTIALLVEKQKDTGVEFTMSQQGDTLTLFAKGIGGHAAQPWESNNALTAMLQLLASLPLADSEGFAKLKSLAEMFPHGDWKGENAGVASNDPIAGDTTISLNILTMDETSLISEFDGRCSLNATEENLNQNFIKETEKRGLIFDNKPLAPPHHVACDTPFVQTLLAAYEQYTGEKGECLAIGGGTYVHNLENGVAFGASMPGTNNNMHGADEFAVIHELVTAAKIYTQAIVDLCGPNA